MKKKYNTPTCNVETMKVEPVMDNHTNIRKIYGSIDGYSLKEIGWGGFDTQGGAGADADKSHLWDEFPDDF